MRGVRVLRYVGNREKPEPEVYSSVERMVRMGAPISSQTFEGLTDAIIASIAKDIPNPMFSDFHKNEGAHVFTPINPLSHLSPIFHFVNTPMFAGLYGIDKEEPKRPPEVDFEVNMMEALEGWKCWEINGQTGILFTQQGCTWLPDKPTEAKCNKKCEKVPAEHHGCGIYAAGDRSTAYEYGTVLGMVYGWGRYIRHENGWKAQFAYPKCFYLAASQIGLVDLLKQYHVPIYCYQPMRMYDPTEEGYDGYWTEEANGNCGTTQEPSPGEEGTSYEED